MNLKTLKKEVASNVYKRGETFLKLNAVRELEEHTPSQFIAFVDEREHSFDVSITLDEAFAIVSASCDCEDTDPFCSHKVAVALHLKDRGKSANNSIAKKIKARKVDPARQFIDDIPNDQLKQWLFDLTKVNKEFHQLLKIKFEKRIISLVWEEIETIHKDKIKAILKTAKYYDASQLQKILGLLSGYHQELIEEIFLQPTIDFNLIDNLIRYLLLFNERARKKGERLEKYVITLNEIIQHRIQESEINKVMTSIEFYLYNLQLEHYITYPFLTVLLEKYLSNHNLINADLINKIITSCNTKNLTLIKAMLISSLEKNNLLKDYIFKFKTEKHSSELNATIINSLIKYDYLKEAERLGTDCIKNSFGYSYYTIRLSLIKIYELTNQPKKKVEQLEFTLMTDFNFEGYKYLENNMAMDEFLNFKKRFTRMLNQYKGQANYGRFYISKYADDQNWKNLLDMIEIDYPFSFYEMYFPQLLTFDRMGLLRKLLNMNYSYYRKMTYQDNESWANTIKDNYTIDEVLAITESKSFYGYEVKEKVKKLYGLADN